jgi:transposase
MTIKELALAYSNKMHSKVPAHCRPMKTFSDKSANDLTKAIIAYAKIKDFFAERQSSEGRYRPGKEVTNVMGQKKQLPGQWLPGQGKGKADIKALIKGRLIEIEVKHGRDKLRPEQIEYKQQIERSGGVYLVVKTWDDFYQQIKFYE